MCGLVHAHRTVAPYSAAEKTRTWVVDIRSVLAEALHIGNG